MSPALDAEHATLLSDDLPPLPTPNHARRYRESSVGAVAVLSLVVTFLSVAAWLHAGGANDAILPAVLRDAFACFFCTYALVAAVCLAYLRWGDPGVLTCDRSMQNVPEEIRHLLLAGEELPKQNLTDASGRSFCVRCLIWRPPPNSQAKAGEPTKQATSTWWASVTAIAAVVMGIRESDQGDGNVHHCSVCQRCVGGFSHHCSFFGRCIAKKNRKYFDTIITMGNSTALTTLLLAAAFGYFHSQRPDGARHSALWWLAVLLGSYTAYWLANGGWQLAGTLGRFWLLRRLGPGRLYTVLTCDDDPPPMPPHPMFVARLDCCRGCSIPVSC